MFLIIPQFVTDHCFRVHYYIPFFAMPQVKKSVRMIENHATKPAEPNSDLLIIVSSLFLQILLFFCFYLFIFYLMIFADKEIDRFSYPVLTKKINSKIKNFIYGFYGRVRPLKIVLSRYIVKDIVIFSQ